MTELQQHLVQSVRVLFEPYRPALWLYDDLLIQLSGIGSLIQELEFDALDI